MSRTATTLTLVTLALVAGWTPAAAQSPTPDPCPLVTAKVANVSVDANAQASPDCVRIKKGKTKVVWTGNADVKTLVIAFKDPATKNPPDDPECHGAQCVLEKAKHAAKQGEFAYSIVVVRKDGSPKSLDPKLIIEPLGP